MPKIVSWNVNGLRAAEKKGFLDILNSFSADIFCIQETKAQPDQLNDGLINAPGYQSFFASAVKKGYSGVACWAKAAPANVITGLGLPEFDNEGRTLTLEYDDFFVVNAYFPNAQPQLARIDYKIAFNNALLKFADSLAKTKAVVVCGDFNVAHKPIDLARPKENEGSPGYSPQERAWMDSFVDAGWVDTFRMFDQNPGNYTWWSFRSNAREKNIGWRIDYFCINQKAKARVARSVIEPAVMGSDHCPILLELS
jgi:exodeoxyribonuclease-3